MLAGKGEAAVRKEIAELVSEAIAFIDRWKNQERTRSDLSGGLIRDREIARTLRALESLVSHLRDDDARRLAEFIETTEGMLHSVEWSSQGPRIERAPSTRLSPSTTFYPTFRG